MIDAHAHLDACDDDVRALVARAETAGVTGIVTVGTGLGSCRAALEIARSETGVYAALGIDPHKAATLAPAAVDELRPLFEEPRAVAVGETGLDYHYGAGAKREQHLLFDAQLALAGELGKPVVIHCRDAAADVAAALARFDGTVVLHCFSEPPLLPAALERGYFVSFAGNVTFPRSHALRAAAREIAPDRLLVETDSPYLAPQPLRGRRNEPANLVHTVTAVAAARGENADELAARTAANARAAFGLP